MEFHERLAQSMMIRKKKQADLAKDLNMSTGGISLLVSGKRGPSEPMIRTLSDYLRVSYTWLKTGEGDMEACPAEDDTISLLAARYRNADEEVRFFLRVLAKMDDEWFRQFAAVARGCKEARMKTEDTEGE